MRFPQDQYAECGFSYVALLIAVAIIGALAAGSLSAGATMQRRAAEEDLLGASKNLDSPALSKITSS